MGRPKKQINAKKVAQMAEIGAPPNEIAAVLNVGISTIKRRFEPVIKKGHLCCAHTVRRQLFNQAAEGNTGAIIFLAKVLLGMKEPRDEAVTVNVTQQAISITDETKRRLSEMHALIRREALLESGGNGNGEHHSP